jgi:hypothetical protein
VLESRGFTDVDFARVMTLGASKIDEVVAEKAGKGNGASAKREVAKALADAGAVTTKTIKKLKETRA